MKTRTEKHLGFRNYAHISEMIEEVVKKSGMTKTAFFNKSMREFRAHYKKRFQTYLSIPPIVFTSLKFGPLSKNHSVLLAPDNLEEINKIINECREKGLERLCYSAYVRGAIVYYLETLKNK